MDLKTFDSRKQQESGAFLHLESPNGERLYTDGKKKEPIGISVLGAHSSKMRALEHKQANARIKGTRIKRGQVSNLTSEQIEENNLDYFATACSRFHHIVVEEEEWDHTRARELLERFPWILNQIAEFMRDENNYLGN